MKRMINKFVVGLIITVFSLIFSSPIAAYINTGLASVGAVLFTGGILSLPAWLASSANSSSDSRSLPCPATVQTMLDAYRLQHNIPAIEMSISLSSSSDQPIYSCYSGTYARDSSLAIDYSSLFEIASLTKSMIATVILQLEAKGKLDINDTVGKWLPEYRYTNWNSITIKQLLNMTAGTYNYFDASFLYMVDEQPSRVWLLKDLTDHAYNNVTGKDTMFAPGRSWFYSNTNYELAGLIIEAASQKSVKENLYSQIFKPLKMTHSIYLPEIVPKDIPYMVRGYTNVSSDYFYDKNILDYSISMANSAGAIISTTEDDLKFVQALFSGSLLPAKQFREWAC